jgi:hypothetical protein
MRPPVLEEHHGHRVFTDPFMDEKRRTHCLCLRCAKLAGCPAAKALLSVCIDNEMALAVTRCPEWGQSWDVPL